MQAVSKESSIGALTHSIINHERSIAASPLHQATSILISLAAGITTSIISSASAHFPSNQR